MKATVAVKKCFGCVSNGKENEVLSVTNRGTSIFKLELMQKTVEKFTNSFHHNDSSARLLYPFIPVSNERKTGFDSVLIHNTIQKNSSWNNTFCRLFKTYMY